jgi:hypothetical protein
MPAAIGTARYTRRAAGLLTRDDFARADSTTSLGATEDGRPWTPGNGSADAVGVLGGVTSRKAVMAAVTGTDPHLWVRCDSPNGVLEVDVDVSLAATNSFEGLLARRVNASNYLLIRLSNNADTVSILRNLAGVRSTAASTALTLANGQRVRLRAVMTPATVKVYADGVLKLTYADVALQGGTRHGIFGLTANAAAFSRWRFEAA